jgi:hypothetical protein
MTVNRLPNEAHPANVDSDLPFWARPQEKKIKIDSDLPLWAQTITYTAPAALSEETKPSAKARVKPLSSEKKVTPLNWSQRLLPEYQEAKNALVRLPVDNAEGDRLEKKQVNMLIVHGVMISIAIAVSLVTAYLLGMTPAQMITIVATTALISITLGAMVAKYRLSNITEKALKVLIDLKAGDPKTIKKELEAIKNRRFAQKIHNLFKIKTKEIKTKLNRVHIRADNPFEPGLVLPTEIMNKTYSSVVIPIPKNEVEIKELEEIYRELVEQLKSTPEDISLQDLTSRTKEALQKGKDLKEAAQESVLQHVAEYETSRLELMTKIEENKRNLLDQISLKSLKSKLKEIKKMLNKSPSDEALSQVERSLQAKLDAHKQAPKIEEALQKQFAIVEAKLGAIKIILHGEELSTDPVLFLGSAQSRLLSNKVELEDQLKAEQANKTRLKRVRHPEQVKHLLIQIEALEQLHSEIKERMDRLCEEKSIDPQEFFAHHCAVS